jgi:hypothetical protein
MIAVDFQQIRAKSHRDHEPRGQTGRPVPAVRRQQHASCGRRI